MYVCIMHFFRGIHFKFFTFFMTNFSFYYNFTAVNKMIKKNSNTHITHTSIKHSHVPPSAAHTLTDISKATNQPSGHTHTHSHMH